MLLDNLTRMGHDAGMNTDIRISELKAHLSENLRKVQKGATVTVYDRDTPIARIVPIEPEPYKLRIIAPTATREGLTPMPYDPRLPDPVALLLEDREKDRNR